MRFCNFSMLLAIVAALIACNTSAAEERVHVDNLEVQPNHVLTDDGGHNRRYLKGSVKKVDPDDVTSSRDEERGVAPALTKLGAIFRKTHDLTKIKNAFANKPPITVIRSADIAKMESTLARNPSLVKTLDKIPLKAAQQKVKGMNGFAHFILNVSLMKLMFVLTLIGIVASGAIFIGALITSG
ncbi:hypothetical protein KRP22_002711 [Phytophthora ramorum]|nr:hypothetical protein KRP22_6358 [Phytophthora ramorum]